MDLRHVRFNVRVVMSIRILPRSDGVVPVPAPLIADEVDALHLFLRDLYPALVFPFVQDAFHLQSLGVRGGTYEIYYDLIVLQRPPFPIPADV